MRPKLLLLNSANLRGRLRRKLPCAVCSRHIKRCLPIVFQADLGVHQPPVDKADIQQVKDGYLVCEFKAVHIVKTHLQQVKEWTAASVASSSS